MIVAPPGCSILNHHRIKCKSDVIIRIYMKPYWNKDFLCIHSTTSLNVMLFTNREPCSGRWIYHWGTVVPFYTHTHTHTHTHLQWPSLGWLLKQQPICLNVYYNNGLHEFMHQDLIIILVIFSLSIPGILILRKVILRVDHGPLPVKKKG